VSKTFSVHNSYTYLLFKKSTYIDKKYIVFGTVIHNQKSHSEIQPKGTKVKDSKTFFINKESPQKKSHIILS